MSFISETNSAFYNQQNTTNREARKSSPEKGNGKGKKNNDNTEVHTTITNLKRMEEDSKKA